VDVFTSGFRGEVAAADGWIGTGARTGVGLDKHEEADETAVNKLEADEAVRVQANCTWLVSGETVTLNFLKKSMPRMGPATAACKKLATKNLPWNCTVFFNETPRGDWLPICPFEKGTRWAGIFETRDNAQCCPSINQVPVICQFVSQENETSICGEVHGRGSGMCMSIRRTKSGPAAN
jgi:hypothetical protein